jgi:hypothetical protein
MPGAQSKRPNSKRFRAAITTRNRKIAAMAMGRLQEQVSGV